MAVSGFFSTPLDDEHIMSVGEEIPPRLWEVDQGEIYASGIDALSILKDKRYLYTQNAQLISNLFYQSLNYTPNNTKNYLIREKLRICGEHFHSFNPGLIHIHPCDGASNAHVHENVDLAGSHDLNSFFKRTKVLLLSKIVGISSEYDNQRKHGGEAPTLGWARLEHYDENKIDAYKVYYQWPEIKEIVGSVSVQSQIKINNIDADPFHNDFLTITGSSEWYGETIWHFDYSVSYITTIDTYIDIDLMYFYRMFDGFSFSDRVNLVQYDDLVYSPDEYTSNQIEVPVGNTGYVRNNMRIIGVEEAQNKIRFFDTLDLNRELTTFFVNSVSNMCNFDTDLLAIYNFDVACNIAAILVFETGGCNRSTYYKKSTGAIIIYDVFSGQVLNVTTADDVFNCCHPHILLTQNEVLVRIIAGNGFYKTAVDTYNRYELRTMNFIDTITFESYQGSLQYHFGTNYLSYKAYWHNIRILDVNNNYNQIMKLDIQNPSSNSYSPDSGYIYIYNNKVYYAHKQYLFVYDTANPSSYHRYDLKEINDQPYTAKYPLEPLYIDGYNDIIVITTGNKYASLDISKIIFLKIPNPGEGINEFVSYTQTEEEFFVGDKHILINTNGIGVVSKSRYNTMHDVSLLETINLNIIDQVQKIDKNDGNIIMSVPFFDSVYTGGGLRYTHPEGLNPGDNIEINCPGEYIPPGSGPGPGPGPGPTPIPTIPPCLSAYAENKKAIVDRET